LLEDLDRLVKSQEEERAFRAANESARRSANARAAALGGTGIDPRTMAEKRGEPDPTRFAGTAGRTGLKLVPSQAAAAAEAAAEERRRAQAEADRERKRAEQEALDEIEQRYRAEQRPVALGR
jgi:hypothetical protein